MMFCEKVVSVEMGLLSYDIACHALSTSGPLPTYGDPIPIVLLNFTVWYSTAFEAGAVARVSKWRFSNLNILLTVSRKMLDMRQCRHPRAVCRNEEPERHHE